MSTQPRLQPTRRTVLRTAAWTAPAVSIAVAAPAFAVSAIKKGKLVGTTSSNPTKYNDSVSASIKHVKWDLTFTNIGNVSLSNLAIVCTFQEQAVVDITAFTVTPGSWTTSQTSLSFSATYSGTVAAGGLLQFTPDFKGANNSKGTLTVAIMDGTTTLATISGVWKP